MRCPHCGADNPNNAVFCGQCGAFLLNEDVPQTEPAALAEDAPQADHAAQAEDAPRKASRRPAHAKPAAMVEDPAEELAGDRPVHVATAGDDWKVDQPTEVAPPVDAAPQPYADDDADRTQIHAAQMLAAAIEDIHAMGRVPAAHAPATYVPVEDEPAADASVAGESPAVWQDAADDEPTEPEPALVTEPAPVEAAPIEVPAAPPAVSDEEVERLVEGLPTNEARRAAEEQARREEEARLAREAQIAQMSEDLDEPDETGALLAAAEALEGRNTGLEPGIIPVSETMLRMPPVELGEGQFVVRNTRDYDHDAQSVNVASSVENFDTIVEPAGKRRDTRRDPYARSARRGEAPGEGNSRSKLRPLLAMLIIALVLGGGGAVLTYGMEMWGGKSVPSMMGESQANAEYQLEEHGLKAKVVEQPADDAIGKVVKQSPGAGERVPEGSTVTITVATNRVIPQVVGATEEDARTALRDAGAERIVTVNKPSSEPEGTVIAISPEEGKTFLSRNDVTITVAGPYTVPDVIGRKEKDAVDAVKAAGLNAEISYVNSERTVRTVVETEPAPGSTIEEGGTVQVRVSSPYPSDPHHLAEFFAHSSQDVNTFLEQKKFVFGNGFMDSMGNALATYTSDNQGDITFSSQPYSFALTFPKEGSSNVLSTGAPIAGVRLDFAAGDVPSTADRAAIDALAKTCGFTGMTDVCDNKTITVPNGTKKIAATFTCGSGKMGDLNWTVLVVSMNGQQHASATCFKNGLYSSTSLGTFNNSLCQFEAYQEVYLNPAYQVVETPKKDTSKKSEKSSDKDSDKSSDKKDTDDTSSNNNASDENKNTEEASLGADDQGGWEANEYTTND